ncbi:MAG: glycosyltransferase family 39 protein [Campylobacterales bacterium]|nr:glycosyltransferase family 39 protein [Campylobacterales bacterium]
MKFLRYIKIEPKPTTPLQIGLMMLIAYSVGVFVRLWLWQQNIPIEAFWLEGRPLSVYSPDAGLYGYYAKELLQGVRYPMDAEHMAGYLIYWIVSIFNLNIDWAMYLLPAFLAPLVAIPTVLMGHALGHTRMGFYAALIAVCGVNYYTRSYVGYMDTDVLNLFLPYMAVASGMMALERRSWLWAVGGVLFLGAFYGWYHSSAVIIAALLGMALIVAPWVLRRRLAWLLSATALLAGLALANYDTIASRAGDYLHKSETVRVEAASGSYHFVDTLQSVAEAQGTRLFFIHDAYVGMAPYTIAATLGFVLLLMGRLSLALALPLLALGFLATLGGLRFVMFATPAFALGFVGLWVIAAQRLGGFGALWTPVIATALGLGVMLLNIARLNPSFAPSYFVSDEVAALRAFAKQSTQEDLLFSWWDYGWPLWYYTGRNNTLIDNGRHGPDTHLAARVLLASNDTFAANALRYFAEQQRGGGEILRPLAAREDIAQRFEDLELLRPVEVNATRDVYLLLHRDMLLTFKTLEEFASIDIKSGARKAASMQLYISDLRRPYDKHEPMLRGDTFDFDLRSGVIRGHDGAQTRIAGVMVIQEGGVVAAQRYDASSSMHLLIYEGKKAIYLDQQAMQTLLVRALLLGQYDRSRFEKVAQTPRMLLLRLK